MKQKESFNKIKQDLRTLFFQKGWGQEIEGVSPEYWKVYVTVLEFINEKFYSRRVSKMDILNNSVRDKIAYTKCDKCGRRRVYYRITTGDYRCRECNALYDKKGILVKEEDKIEMEKIEEPIKEYKPKGHFYFLCRRCGKRKARYRSTTNDYKCRICGAVFKRARS